MGELEKHERWTQLFKAPGKQPLESRQDLFTRELCFLPEPAFFLVLWLAPIALELLRPGKAITGTK